MTQTIVLHGTYKGFIRLYNDGGTIRCTVDGLPPGSIIYIVHGDTPVRIDSFSEKSADGVIVTDSSGRIIAEGRAARGSNAPARMKIPDVTEKAPASPILREILERAESVFGDAAQIPQEKVAEEPKAAVYNPFSAMYPSSRWQRQRDGSIRGIVQVGEQVLDVTAIPAHMYTDAAFTRAGFMKIASADDGTVYRMRVRRRIKGR